MVRGESYSEVREMIIYYSNASWTKIGDTEDRSPNKEFAESICEALIERWGENGSESPCKVRGVCVKTWVTSKQKIETKSKRVELVKVKQILEKDKK